MAYTPITSWETEGEKVEAVTGFIFLGSQITADSDYSHEIKKMLAPWKESYFKSREYITKQRHHFSDKGLYKSWYGFSTSHVRIWELDHKETWVPKNWCFQIVVLEKMLEFLGLQGDQTTQSQRKSTLTVHWKDWCLSCNTLATSCELLTHWGGPWCWGKWKKKAVAEDEMVR